MNIFSKLIFLYVVLYLGVNLVVNFYVVLYLGVSWTLLHEMDYLKYLSARRDYIKLPEGALTNATRLRWWQPFTMTSGLVTPNLQRAQWAIDNILVGGADINPSILFDTFDDGTECLISFYKFLIYRDMYRKKALATSRVV